MKSFLIYLFLLMAFSSWSQLSDTLIVGKPFKNDYRSAFEGVIGEQDTSLFGVEVSYKNQLPDEIKLSKVGRKMKPTVSYLLNEKKDTIDAKIQPEKVFLLKDRVLYFETLDITDSSTRYLMLKVFDFNGELKSAGIIDTIADYKTFEDQFYIFESLNESQFVVAKTIPFKRRSPQKVEVRIFNHEGSLLQKDLFQLPYTEKNFQFSTQLYDGEQKLYFLSKEKNEKPGGFSSEKYLISNAYYVWAYDLSTEKVKEFEIEIKDKWINDLDIVLDQEKNLHVAGYYSNDRLFSVIGTFQIVINQNNKIVHSQLKAFANDFKTPASERSESNELVDIYLRGIKVNAYGEIFIVGEHYYKEVSEYFDPRSNMTTYYDNFYFGALWITKYNAQGKMTFTTRIPKKQFSVNDGGLYLSSFTAPVGQNLYVFFNDHEKNATVGFDNEKDIKEFQNSKRALLTGVKIDEKGSLKKVLAKELEDNFIMIPQNTEQLNSETIYFIAEKGREVKLLKFLP